MVTLYARSDLVSVAIPAESGGCGSSHYRPVISGAPVRTWQLDCPACTVQLKNDDLWSHNPARVPLTPDEERVIDTMKEDGARIEAQKQSVDAYMHKEKVRGELEAQRTREQHEAERSMLEMRLAQMSAEMDRLRQLLESDAARSAVRAPEEQPAPVETPAAAVVTRAPVRQQKPAQGRCTSCGGFLRKPGTKGPSPKGTCMNCRSASGAKAKVT